MLALDLSTFPLIETERLLLREPVRDDVPALFALRSDERVMRHVPRPMARTMDDVAALIDLMASDREASMGVTWAIARKPDRTMIGTIGFYRLDLENHRAEVGYLLAPDHQGCGIMAEALSAVVRVGFDRFHFHGIEAITDPRNTASNRVLERAGFERDALLRQNFLWNGEFQDSAVYSILAGHA